MGQSEADRQYWSGKKSLLFFFFFFQWEHVACTHYFPILSCWVDSASLDICLFLREECLHLPKECLRQDVSFPWLTTLKDIMQTDLIWQWEFLPPESVWWKWWEWLHMFIIELSWTLSYPAIKASEESSKGSWSVSSRVPWFFWNWNWTSISWYRLLVGHNKNIIDR